MAKKEKMIVYLGGWYQRTTLHLTEIANFLSDARSDLALDKNRLKSLRDDMGLTAVSREQGSFEYVKAVTKEGVEINYFEDGLYVLKIASEEIWKAKDVLQNFHDEKFAPGIAYIFSLGAPTPKELANIKVTHPVAIGVVTDKPEKYIVDEQKFGVVYSEVSSAEMVVKKTPGYIFIITEPKYADSLEGLIEMQIFFREYKDQLQKYLDIHRHLWEEISEIKERKAIRGRDVEKVRLELDAYQKTIGLISSRINQMGSYVRTRAEIAKETKLTEHLSEIFQYKFDVLTNTHGYIREIWTMTNNYLSSAIAVVSEIKTQATNKSIQSLRVITTYGVVGGIIGYLSRDSLPVVTKDGVVYFLVLIVATFAVNWFISWVYTAAKYKLMFSDRVKNI